MESFMEKEPMTIVGYKKITNELETLKKIDRPATVIALEEARQLGDLKENAEYHAAKDKLKLIDIQIAQMGATISKAIIIKPEDLPHDRVSFGSTVKILDLNTQEEFIYVIVGSVESNPDIGLISFNSPLAKKLLSKEEGSEFKLNVPNGERTFEILDVYYKEIQI